MAVQHFGRAALGFGTVDSVFRHFIPGYVEVNVLERGIAHQLFDDIPVRGTAPVGTFSCLSLHRVDHTPEANMRPDDGCVRVPPQEIFHLFQVNGFCISFRESLGLSLALVCLCAVAGFLFFLLSLGPTLKILGTETGVPMPYR